MRVPAILIAAVATFAVALGVLSVVNDSSAPRQPDPSARVPAAAATELSAAATTRSASARIRRLQAAVRAAPDSAVPYTRLAEAYLQSVRETGDPSLYARADEALRRALRIDPREVSALTASGGLALARHDFRAGLELGRRAQRLAPDSTQPLAVIADALVELGRYDEAATTLQRMVDLKPNLAAYARVSYFRELHGDLDGALRAMSLAVSAGAGAKENVAYVRSLLGSLQLMRGKTTAAGRTYRQALAQLPGHVPASVGVARVDAAQGRLGEAIRRLDGVVERLPLPEHVIALGEAELAAGRSAAGRRTLELVEVQRGLLARAGVNTDVELALFESDHGSARQGLELARRAWAAAPSVRSADAVGWALTRAGRPAEGLRWARRALRLGSRDPGFVFHAGIAAREAGQPALARRWLADVAGRRGALGPLRARAARRALRGLA
jgi:tetratricopeptide (TPR) repeat protein